MSRFREFIAKVDAVLDGPTDDLEECWRAVGLLRRAAEELATSVERVQHDLAQIQEPREGDPVLRYNEALASLKELDLEQRRGDLRTRYIGEVILAFKNMPQVAAANLDLTDAYEFIDKRLEERGV